MLLRFRTSGDRSAFLDRLAKEAPELGRRAKSSYAQPTVVTVRTVTREDKARLLGLAGLEVVAFDDVQFSTLPAR